MKDRVKKSVSSILADRKLMSLIVVNLIVAIIVVIFLVTIIKPSEAQVTVRYASYGIANFYRGYWYELLGYAALAVIIAVGHSLLAAKLSLEGRRELASALLWLTIVVLIILALFARSIIKIAALGG